jgi:hypothetical protein
MKALPWILVLGLLAAAGFFFNAKKKSEAELAKVRQENATLAEAHAALEAKAAEAQNDGANLSAKEREELIKLRNEVGQLRREKLQLGSQVQQAQQKADQLLQSQQAQKEQQIQLQKQNQQLAQSAEDQRAIQARNQCINNLRQMDGAIQQWALENKQPASATVTMENILPYLGNGNSAAPACPSGGIYTLGTVEAQPTCNIPGHTLSQ